MRGAFACQIVWRFQKPLMNRDEATPECVDGPMNESNEKALRVTFRHLRHFLRVVFLLKRLLS